ncbi:MAG: hypothetical protein RLZZ175_3243 [Bacteroidota bacterium]|jgi:chitinase
MKQFYKNIKNAFILSALGVSTSFAQIPKPACVGYWQNWSNNLKLTAINDNYNVIQLAFGTTVGTSLSNITFTLPSNYNKTTFMADIDVLHTKGKVVILSLGGANDPIRLDNTTARDEFVTSVNKILSDYSYKIDGIDIDFESSSLAFGATWTMTAPSVAQQNLIDATKSIMANYKTQTGKKLLLTMAPESIYLMGALSSYQVANSNGGAMLPIIQALSNELDLIHVQYYNAGGAGGGTYAIDKKIYYDNSDPDYITAMTESIIKGFTLLSNKGVYNGLPASKVAIGLPSNRCDAGTGSGYNTPADVCSAVKYLQGKITKPAGWTYTVTQAYPDLAGMMAWSINEDLANCDGAYSYANNFSCAFPKSVTAIDENIDIELNTIYPNPTNGQLNFNLTTNQEVKIYNSTGFLLISKQLTPSENLNIESFEPGLYFVKVGKKISKIVKN